MIIRFSELRHSPYVCRRNFTLHLSEAHESDIIALDILRQDDIDLHEYTREFCKECNNDVLCFRHQTAVDLVHSLFSPPTDERYVKIEFDVADKDVVTLKKLSIKFTEWRAKGDEKEITITTAITIKK